MADRRQRFWQLFRRQFLLLLSLSLGLIAVLFVGHAVTPLSEADWIKFGLLDIAVLLGASALSAWLKVLQEAQRGRGRRDPG
jgi:hypothetical protein